MHVITAGSERFLERFRTSASLKQANRCTRSVGASIRPSKIVYSQVHNKQGGQIKRGGLQRFRKIIKRGVKIKGGLEQNIKEKRRN